MSASENGVESSSALSQKVAIPNMEWGGYLSEATAKFRE